MQSGNIIHPSYVVLKSSEQQPSNAKAVLFFFSIHLSVDCKEEGKRKWIIQSENHVSSQ